MAKTIEPPPLEEIRRWGATTDLVKAGTAFGIGRTKSYELARAGEFPVRVIRIGRAYCVPVAEILAQLDRATDAEVA